MRTEGGHYWVRSGGDWFIAEWDGVEFVTTTCCSIPESELDEIDEREIVREPPKPSPEEIAEKTERLRISQERGDRINDVDWLA